MTSLQIEYFLAVAESMSFSAAAKKKFIAQPSISKHIRHLETELGTALFDRTAGRNLKLTYAGKLYLDFFREALQRMDEIKQENRKYLEALLGEVRIGVISSMNTANLLFEILDNCSKNHPNINIHVLFLSFNEIEQALLTGQVDLVIHLRDFIAITDGIVVQKLANIQKSIFSHEDFLPSGKKELQPEDFRDKPFLVLDPAEFALVKPNVIAYCQEFGFTPIIKYVPNIESMIGGVRSKQGVAVFDALMDFESEKIKSFPLPMPHEAVLAWKGNHTSNAVHIVANELLTEFQKKLGQS